MPCRLCPRDDDVVGARSAEIESLEPMVKALHEVVCHKTARTVDRNTVKVEKGSMIFVTKIPEKDNVTR